MSTEHYDAVVRLVYGLKAGTDVSVASLRTFELAVANLTKAAVVWRNPQMMTTQRFQCRAGRINDTIVVTLAGNKVVNPETLTGFEKAMEDLLNASVPFFTWYVTYIRVEIDLTGRVSFSTNVVPDK